MDRDVSPALLEAVQAAFRGGIENSKKIAEIQQLILDGKMTYALAQKYAAELGGVLSDAYLGQITPVMLPNGRMYYHIARDVLTPTLTEGYDMAAEAAMAAQMAINEGMQLSIRPVPPAAPADRINGIIEKITGAEQFEDVQWVLKAPVVNLIQNAVDETVRANADFHAQAGLSPRIIRTTTGSSCPWCRQMAGIYDHPCDRDVYRRHDRCDCVVEYDPGDGRRQNAHTKIWQDESREERKQRAAELASIGETENDRISRVRASANYVDVTAEYLSRATPGEGRIVEEAGFRESNGESAAARWIHKVFGGDIFLLAENNPDGLLNPDFLWNGTLWDLKTIESNKFSTIDKRIRKGINQIIENPGGIIVDFTKSDLSFIEAVNNTHISGVSRTKSQIDIIVKKGTEFLIIRL